MIKLIYTRLIIFSIVSTVIVLFFAWLWFIVPSYLFIVKKAQFSFDPLLAPLVKQSIVTCVEENFLHKSFRALSLDILKSQFPEIYNAHVRYNQGLIHCTIKAQKPLLCVNENYLLMANGKLIDKTRFDQRLIRALQTLQMKNTVQEITPSYCKALNKIPSCLFERFDLIWNDHTCITLHDKIDPNFFVYTDIFTTMNNSVVNQYEKIKKEILSQRSFAKKQWRLDVRFKNQIVVAQKGMGDL